MNNFIASCLGGDWKILDKYCDAFHVEIDENDIYEALSICSGNYKNFGTVILEKIWKYVEYKFSSFLDEEKFDCDCTSPFNPSFYYNKKEVYCENDLIEIIKK